jgi:large conductance mechanosensitive channel
MSMLKEFKEFAIKGNMIDIAVGFIIGAASSKVVSSLVNDIIMPPLGYFIGRVNFSDLKAAIFKAQLGPDGTVVQPEIVINYGNFLQITLDFLIMAFVLFLVVKLFNILRRRAEDEKVVSVPTPRDIELLAKINDTLGRIENNSKSGN